MLLPLSRPVVPVTFTGVKGPVVALHGRNPRDVWVLYEDELVRTDGKKVLKRFKKPCKLGAKREYGTYGTVFTTLLVERDTVMLVGDSLDPNSRLGSDYTAILDARGRWRCDTEKEDITPVYAVSDGDRAWKLAHNMSNAPCRLKSRGGVCAPVPVFAAWYVDPPRDSIDMGVHSRAVWMRGTDDGWLVTADEEWRDWLLRYNGVAWTRVANLGEHSSVSDLWADDAGHAWLMGLGGIVRFDGKEMRRIPVPAGFEARFVRGTSARDVWFAGAGKKVYQWDGEKLRRGDIPFDVENVWSSPGGEVWFAGGSMIAHTAPLPEAR